MRIQTGQGTIPLITLIGIWSISALNALPGLAVSPILGRLSAIFPHYTVLKNIIDAPVHVQGKSKEETEKTARALLKKVGLKEQYTPIIH